MPIEMPCTGCGQRLRVGDEHAGKLARCPQCGTIVHVPEGGAGEPASQPWQGAPPADDPGHRFGASPPRTPAEPETPFASPAARKPVEREDPFAASAARKPVEAENPFADKFDSVTSPYASPSYPARGFTPTLQPHRGGLILTLGILGVACCMISGIVAWVMGAADLKAIREGRMDPGGRGMTQAGMVLGIISVVLAVLGILFNIAVGVAHAC